MININEISIGDSYKKIGSNLILEVVERGYKNGSNYVVLMNKDSKERLKLTSLKHYIKYKV